MDFDLTESQHAARGVARSALERFADPLRLAAVERADERFDRELWQELATNGVLGLAVPAKYGGAGLDLFDVAPVLIEHGQRLCLVPLLESAVLAALGLTRFGDDAVRAEWLPRIADGTAVATVALEGLTHPWAGPVAAAGDGALTGTVRSVPFGHIADVAIVPARAPSGAVGLSLVRLNQPGVLRDRYERTDRGIAADLRLDGAAAVALDAGPAGDGPGWLLDRAWLGLAAIGLGVSQAAVAQTAAYLSQRRQFGVPLATFQAAAHQAANCHVDVQAMEVTLWDGLWRLATERPLGAAAHVAKWWAAEAGDRVARTVQHLHGGIGSDVTYPIHRYMLWTSQLANTLGGASWHLDRVGGHIAAGAA